MKKPKLKITLISLLLIFLYVIGINSPEYKNSTGKKQDKPVPIKTIIPKPSKEPKIDPWSQYAKFKVDWREYSINFELLLKEKFDAKDCGGLQAAFDALVLDNKDHAAQYGHNNVNMMRFVDYLLKQVNCYT